MKRAIFLAVVGGALAVTAITNASPPKARTGSPPAFFVAKYHLSGYGVFHLKTTETDTLAPCQTGGRGGGAAGTLQNDTTIRWQTVRPATVTVQRASGGQPFLLPRLDPKTGAPGAIATVTVTSTTTDDRTRTTCDLAGDPLTTDEPGKLDRTQCGTHTYPAGYYMPAVWPHVPGHPGSRIAVSVPALPATGKLLPIHWGFCWEAATQIASSDGAEINAPLPFADLPRKIRGKLTVIAHGGKVTVDDQQPQNTGGTIHNHSAFNGTSYVTLVRIR